MKFYGSDIVVCSPVYSGLTQNEMGVRMAVY